MKYEVLGYPIFYSSESVAKGGPGVGVSAGKPELVVERWKKYGKRVHFFVHPPIEVDELTTVHDQDFVEGVLTLSRQNGFGNRHPAVPRSVLFTNGGLLNAARVVLREKWVGACAPYSGFHRAGKDFTGGLCTFNGLTAAAYSVLEDRLADSVLILDCDYHYGNGTQDILDRGDDNTGSIHHWSSGQMYTDPKDAPDFLAALPDVIKQYRHVDLVLYQAGADMHVRDQYGGLLTTSQMQARDRIVFECCYEHSLPVVWCLAGGYQEPMEKVLKLHDQTLREAMKLHEL